MKMRWLIICCGAMLLMAKADAQTFKLKPVTLLPAAKKEMPVAAPPPTAYPVYLLAPNTYYEQHFGFFCKQEWVLQKHTGVPVRFRLGNYSYTQQLEGKK